MFDNLLNKDSPKGSTDGKIILPYLLSTVIPGMKSKNPSPSGSGLLFLSRRSKSKEFNNILFLKLSGQISEFIGEI